MASTSFSPSPTPHARADGPPCADGVSDGQLLDRFIDTKDEAAFAELVRRHARMVLGVCQRVLANPHDAEDCFQAAFLVLVRKAQTIKPREMVGNWLYGVAYRTALEAKKMAARRRNRERKKFDMPRPEGDSDRWADLQPLLDEELSRLPDKYRYVLIACDLEQRTRKEVARAMHVPEGTVASRLARARQMLAKRLNRHKLGITASALALLLGERASAVFVPASLTSSTTHAAALLAAGKPVAGVVSGNVGLLVKAAVKSMLIAKLTIASTALVILAIIGLGVGTLLPPASADWPEYAPKTAIDVKKVKPRHLKGCVLEGIDPDTMTIQATLLDAADGTELRDFKLEASTAIIIEGKNATLSDLKLGDIVNVQFHRTPDGRATALRVEIESRSTTAGVVHAITDAAVTLQSDIDGIKATHKLHSSARVFVNGKKGKLGEVKANMPVVLGMPPDRREIVSIIVTGPVVTITSDKR